MTVDKILVRMPKEFEYFLPAVSVTHEYVMQVQGQGKPFLVKIEMVDESHLFFAPLFPRMAITLGGSRGLREHWDCVLDFRDIDRAKRIGKATKLHVTEAWGILFGGNPTKIPNLGYLGARVKQESIDVLVDCNVPVQVMTFFRNNYPDAKVVMDQVDGLRPGNVFDRLCDARMYIGRRSAATYMAATMGKALVELYPNDMPSWWLAKPASERYKLIYGSEFPAELIWVFVEEIWQSLCNTKFPNGTTMARPVSTAVSASAR